MSNVMFCIKVAYTIQTYLLIAYTLNSQNDSTTQTVNKMYALLKIQRKKICH